MKLNVVSNIAQLDRDRDTQEWPLRVIILGKLRAGDWGIDCRSPAPPPRWLAGLPFCPSFPLYFYISPIFLLLYFCLPCLVSLHSLLCFALGYH